MANLTVAVAQTFPDGTSVGAYLDKEQVSGSSLPLGTAISTAAVTAGTVAFTGLAEDESYQAIGQVSGQWRRVGFTVNVLAPPVPVNESSTSINVKSATYGARGDGTNNDTAAIIAAIAAASAAGGGTVFLPRGIYLFNSLLTVPSNVVLVGEGSRASVLKCGTTAAGIQYGGGVGGTQTGHGRSGGFQLDGNLLSTVGLKTNTGYSSFDDIFIQRVNGDALSVLGQNTNYTSVFVADNSGAGIVLDNGAGANHFFACHSYYNSAFNIDFRQSAASTAGAYLQPTGNHFYGGIAERSGSPSFGGTGLGAVRHRAGTYNRFEKFEFVNLENTSAPGVSIVPNTASGQTGVNNGRLYFEDCTFTGTVGNTVGAIHVDAVTTGTAGPITSDYIVVLQGQNVFAGWPRAIKYGCTTPSLDLSGFGGNGEHHSFYTCPIFWTANGTGAQAAITSLYPQDWTITRDLYLAQSLRVTGAGGWMRLQKGSITTDRQANNVAIQARDDGAGKTQLVAAFQNDLFVLAGEVGAVEAWTAVTYQNSWADYGSGYQGCRYRKNGRGQVEIEGLAIRAAGASTLAIFTLPAGYRPAANMLFAQSSSGAHSELNITTAGVVSLGVALNATSTNVVFAT